MEEAATEPAKAEPVAEPEPAVEEKMEEATPATPVAAAEKSSPAKKVEESKPESPKKTEKDAKPAEGTPKDPKEKRGTKRKRNDDEPYVVNEDEPEIPNDFMCLDWQNSDLTLKVNKETFLAAEPFHSLAWGYIFSR